MSSENAQGKIVTANLPVVSPNQVAPGTVANQVLATVSPAKSHAGVGIAYF